MQKRIFNKNWLIFSKTQFSTQNGVRPRKTVLSKQSNEKHSKTVLLTQSKEKHNLGKTTSFLTYT